MDGYMVAFQTIHVPPTVNLYNDKWWFTSSCDSVFKNWKLKPGNLWLNFWWKSHIQSNTSHDYQNCTTCSTIILSLLADKTTFRATVILLPLLGQLGCLEFLQSLWLPIQMPLCLPGSSPFSTPCKWVRVGRMDYMYENLYNENSALCTAKVHTVLYKSS